MKEQAIKLRHLPTFTETNDWNKLLVGKVARFDTIVFEVKHKDIFIDVESIIEKSDRWDVLVHQRDLQGTVNWYVAEDSAFGEMFFSPAGIFKPKMAVDFFKQFGEVESVGFQSIQQGEKFESSWDSDWTLNGVAY